MIEILLFLILLVLLFGAGAVVTGLWWLFGIALAVALIAGAVALSAAVVRFAIQSGKDILQGLRGFGSLVTKSINYIAENPRVLVNIFILPYPLAFWIYKRISPFDGPLDAIIHGSIGIIGWFAISLVWFFVAVGALAAVGEALGFLPFASPSHR